MRRTRVRLVSACVVASALVLAVIVFGSALGDGDRSATSTARAGAIGGNVPLCFGPGLDMNITPTLMVVAAQHGETRATVTVPATTAAHAYRLSLPPGTYTVRAGAWPARQVTVRAGETTAADLPGGTCV